MRISSSAVSNHIREIEEDFGLPLFYRTTRTVSLTPEGVECFTGFQEIVSDIQLLIDDLRETTATRSVGLNVACVPTLSETLLPTAVKAFSGLYPKADIRVLDFGTRQLAALIQRGHADFGITPYVKKMAEFDAIHLFHEPLRVIAAADSPLAKQRQVSFNELAKHNLIVLKSSKSVAAMLEQAQGEAGISLQPTYELRRRYSIFGLVNAGCGIAILPAMAMPLEGMPGLVSLPLAEPRVTRPICIVWRKNGRLSSQVRELIAIIKGVIRDVQKVRFNAP